MLVTMKALGRENIDAITFCDNDMTRIHTPKDTAEYISLDSIARCYDVASKEIVKYTFKDSFLIIYYKECTVISIIGILIFSLLYKKKLNSRKRKSVILYTNKYK